MTRIATAVLIFFAPLVLSAQDDEKIIRNILATQTNSWNRGDINGFMRGYWENDSLMFIGKSGVTYGWKNTLNNYKKNYSDTTAMGKLNFDIIQLKRLSSEYFSVTGKWFLKRTIGDLSGHFTLLFRKINNEWVIVSDHSS
jgi:ketosteroid isomerase-like protein